MSVEARVGDLLVAQVGVNEEPFDNAVVLILDRDYTGTLGVVINKVSSLDFWALLPQWAPLTCFPTAIFWGGPVSPDGAICLATLSNSRREPPGWRRLHRDVGLLHLDTPIPLAEGAYRSLRVFAGYSGWAAGQLEDEIRRGAWHVVPSWSNDPFDANPATLWRRVLRRQPNELAYFSTWVIGRNLN